MQRRLRLPNYNIPTAGQYTGPKSVLEDNANKSWLYQNHEQTKYATHSAPQIKHLKLSRRRHHSPRTKKALPPTQSEGSRHLCFKSFRRHPKIPRINRQPGTRRALWLKPSP